MKRIFIISLLLIAATMAVFAQQNRGGAGSSARGYVSEWDMAATLANIPLGELDQAEIDGMLLMREEEKLARDVYLTLAEMWSIRSFENIARSEETHMDAMKSLLDRYDIDDPVKSDEVGSFTSPLMQELYDELVGAGDVSYIEALKVGAKIEELDIADLLGLIDATDNDDIRIVYQNLLKGSRNHLRSFDMQIQKFGGSYTPEHLSPEEYDRIASSDRETGSLVSDPNYVF